jgi:small subunit ribosomal protein S3
MGQKVNPHGFRVGPTLNKNWDSLFFADHKYGQFLIEDLKIRKYVSDACKVAQVSKVIIERSSGKNIVINVYVRKPGVVIGKSGSDIDVLKKKVSQISSIKDVFVNVYEIKKPDIDSALIAQSVAIQLEKRISYRRAIKKAMQSCMKAGARGIKIACSGRIGGAEIARSEWYREGRVPLHTLRADIDYATAEANTTYGVLGIKVWVYKGNFVENKKLNKAE